MVRGLGARGIEAQRPEMAGLDDSGGLLGLVTRRKKGREKGEFSAFLPSKIPI